MEGAETVIVALGGSAAYVLGSPIGSLTVAGTSLRAIVPTNNVLTGTYRARVLDLSPTWAPVGTVSSPLTFMVVQ